MSRVANTPEEIKRLVPLKMQGQNRWVVWVREGDKRPVLYQPSEQRLIQAFPNDPYTWDSFEEAVKALLYNPVFAKAYEERRAGIGYINSQATPLVTITVYGALQSGPKVAPWALPYFDVLDAYAEEGLVPGSVVFLWEGPQEPFSKAGVSVAQPPFILLTLRKVAGTPVRVGTAKTRYQKFLEMVAQAAERLASKVEERFAQYGPSIAQALGKLVEYGLRWRKERRAIATCPVCRSPKPTLSIAIEDKLYLSCAKGCTPQDVVAALGLTWDEGSFSAKPLKEDAGLAPIGDDEAYTFVDEAYMALFAATDVPPLLREYGLSYETATALLLGLQGDNLVIPLLLDEGGGRLLYSYTVLSPQGEVVKEVPEEGGFWASPGYKEASVLVVVGEPMLALALWNILSRDPRRSWGVLYASDPRVLVSLVRKGKAEEVYLWTADRIRQVGEWREALRALPVRVKLCPVVSPPFGQRVEAVKAVQEAIAQAEPLV
jgi:hypothetical protein